jgi:hypothetical protein
MTAALKDTAFAVRPSRVALREDSKEGLSSSCRSRRSRWTTSSQRCTAIPHLWPAFPSAISHSGLSGIPLRQPCCALSPPTRCSPTRRRSSAPREFTRGNGRQYSRQALAMQDLNWSVTNACLYKEVFTGRACSITRCSFCLLMALKDAQYKPNDYSIQSI